MRRLWFLLPLLNSWPALAQEGAPKLRVQTPGALQVGEVRTLSIALTLPAVAAQPVLLTPTVEGEALEVVRGRLMQGDAEVRETSREQTEETLWFELPVVARLPGTSILRLQARLFVCPQDDCQPVSVETELHLTVLPR